MSQANGDHEMTDAVAGAEANESGNGEYFHERQMLRLLPGATETAASFAFEKEDHTLGNALRYMITKNPKVEFCGYTIPHPSEPFMNLRIQTDEDTTVFEVLRQGLDDLSKLCDVVEDKFTAARDEFNAAHPERTKPDAGKS